MADANNATRSDLDATGSIAPELQHKGGEPTPAAGTLAEPGDQPETDPAEYAKLLDFYDSSFRNIAEGEVVKGTVLKVTESEVIVDVGYKSEGIIAVQEFLDENGQVTVQPGDIVDVLLERTEDRDGYVVLSREKAEKMKIWDEVEKAYRRQEGRHRPRHRADQGRAGGRHRRAGVPARVAGGRAPRAQPGCAARPGTAHARHQGEQEARQHRPLAEGPPRRRERREEEAHARDAGRGQGAARRGEEHHRLRRLHRPRRDRRPAAHHRHVVGPRRAPVGAVQGQRRDRRHRPQVRPGHRARLARLQAAQRRPVVGRRRAVSGGHARGGQGGEPDRLRRLHRARSRASKG